MVTENRFTIVEWAFEDDEYVSLFTGFCSDKKSYVAISLSKEVTSQDHELGLDGVHIEINDQIRSGYDLIKKGSVSGSQAIVLEFKPNAQKRLRIDDGSITLEFEKLDTTSRENATRKIVEILKSAGIPVEE